MFRISRSHLQLARRVIIVSILAALMLTSLGTQQVVRADGGIAVINVTALNLRATPNKLGHIIATIPAGTQMTAIARNVQSTWVLVQIGSLTGWMSTLFLLIASPVGNLPAIRPGVVLSTGGPGGGNSGAGNFTGITATAFVTMNIRGGPGRRYPIIGKLLTGETVQLTGHVGFWLRFKFHDGGPAWVHISLVELDGGTLDDLPEVSFPPS